MARQGLTVLRDGRRLELVPVDRLVRRWLIAAGLALVATGLLLWLP